MTTDASIDIIAGGELANRLIDQVGEVLIGQESVVRQVLTCLLAGGHVLIEGVPGLGKTLLVRALAKSFGGESGRVQFTPDLMPSDVTGHAIFNMQEQRFVVRRGPAFTNLLLADEINRAPAKTQAALLEVMAERQITIEGDSLPVTEPFMVLATQNPLEQDGTYPLPEAQLDRFMMKVLVSYPERPAELELVRQQVSGQVADGLNVDSLEPLLSLEDTLALRRTCAAALVDDAVLGYAVAIVRKTRAFNGISQGASPRASIAIVAAARVQAVLSRRDFVTPDDVKTVALPILRHRIQLSPDREIEGQSADAVLTELFDGIEAPRL